MSDIVAIASIDESTYKTELRAGQHTLLADEPRDAGGTDLGPRPGDLLQLSLASCVAITLRMYANRKGWLVHNIEVRVSGELEDGKTTLRSDVSLSGKLSEEQKRRMLQIAKLCPVHKTLMSPIEIQTSLQ